MNYKKYSTDFAGREVVVEVGKTSCMANGACWVRYGDTVVMSHATINLEKGWIFFRCLLSMRKSYMQLEKSPVRF